MTPGHLGLTADNCAAVGEVVARIGDKWSGMTLLLLAEGSQRFSELKRAMGTVSQKVLTSTLRGLERDGYITRTVTPSIPPRVDYALTPLGHDVLVPIRALATWAVSRREAVEAARHRYDAREAPGTSGED